MFKKMINFFKDEEGATMVEYALMLSLSRLFVLLQLGIGAHANVIFDDSATSLTP